MEFQKNVAVQAANGQTVGHLDRVVVDAESKAVTHIVVHKGTLGKEAKVVPISAVAEALADHVKLTAEAGDLHAFQDFEEQQYVMSGDPTATEPAVVVGQPISGIPSTIITEPAPRYIKEMEQHIPRGTVALKEGAKVKSTEGKEIGHVEKVMVDAQTNHATNLVIVKGLLSKERKLVPMSWVKIISDNEVMLTVEPKQVDALEPYAGTS
jgi:uncharacterized protein YrrD